MKKMIAWVFLLALVVSACASSSANRMSDSEMQQYQNLLAKADVRDVVNRLFISTDNREWDSVKAVFAPEVLFENSGVISSEPAEPILGFTNYGVVQGFIEQSNVNPVMEMTGLIAVSRAFESLAAAIDDTQSTLQNAIRTLGDSS